MEYRVLGPLEALGSEGPLPLGGAKQRALLALLLLNANRVVSRERLIDELWGENPPETAVTSVQVYVSRLRKLLPDGSLVTRAPGYVLEVEPENVDLIRFERLVKDGRAALAAGDPVSAADTMRAAIALWRGPALTEFAAEPFAQIEGGRLDDLRVAALEERIDADLQLGRHGELTGELEVLITSHPHRERLRAQLMLALYRAGRQSEALDVYRDLRATLDEIGIAPGENLQRLERQILNHDCEIDAPALPIAEAPAPAKPLERQRVTVLFAALDATNELEDDPVQTASFFDRLQDEATAEIEAAGGTVEKGLVGALLATFGGDEHAAQAASAALATRRRLTRAFGEGLSLRIALETGDVIVGRDSLVMGTPVAASARLVGLAQPADIVVGHRAGQALEAAFELREHGRAHVLVGPRAQPVTREVRKTVTVLFADLVDSTRLGQELDLEVLSLLMSEYFRAMQAVVARHGGIVEKFIGDAVMAVFGVPVLHEDDALRAVRAATEMRESLAGLNERFETTWGVRLEGRIGINSGEVMAGDHLQGHLIVTGPAVTVAKRFEEAAAANEILISEATHRLVRDAVVVEPISHRGAKGGETLDAHAVVQVRPHTAGRARRFDTPLVDREQEFSALLNTFEHVVESRECHLLTVLGDAGVGKSRLVQEFAREIGAEATVLHGRCLPYGEGITYWPLADVVRDIVNSEGSTNADPSPEAIAALLPHEERAGLIADLIAEALGLSGNVAGSEQTFWAVRKLFESLAQTQPLVVVFDDLQWAEPTFLDLVDYLADHTRDAPLLLLCVARPELFDIRRGWGGGKRHATTTSLEPLGDDDARRLITNLLGGQPLPAEVQTRIADLAEGNALFTEELLAMLVDEKRLVREDTRWVVAGDLADLRVPQEINAFLAARLERLPKGEHTLLVRGAVEGALFHYDALRELSPELSEATLQRDLATLVRRDLIRPDRSSFAGEDAYRFRHILIRDASYDSLSKTTRAELHERFADWLEGAAGERIREYEEIVGYHLEQAYLCHRDIGSANEDLTRLGARASERLESAGRRALARADLPAAIRLLERASNPRMVDGGRRARLLPELGAALIGTGRKEQEAERVLAEARQLAAATQDECADAHAIVQQQILLVFRAEAGAPDEATRAVASVIPIFERCGDEHGLCRAWQLQGLVQWNAARAAASIESRERAATHARLAGDEDERSEILSWVGPSMVFGPTPVGEAIARCDEIRVEVAGNQGAEAWVLRSLAGLHAMDGSFDVARDLLAAGNAIFDDLGQARNSAATDIDGIVEMLAGDLAAAEERLRAGYVVLEEMGDKAFRPTTAAHLSQALFAQGRADEALRFTHISEDLALDDDLLTQVVWRGVRSRILLGQGRFDEAEELAREAVTLSEATDFLNTQAGALLDLAQICHDTGRLDESNDAAAEALRLFEQKGNGVAARKVRAQLPVLSKR
ncbi:MAG: BTAD domain-containing putative transcriptional regulator [Gaiellaceae bacterium]